MTHDQFAMWLLAYFHKVRGRPSNCHWQHIDQRAAGLESGRDMARRLFLEWYWPANPTYH